LTAQIQRKKLELERAKARIALAETVVATHDRLNKRRPAMVSPEEMRKAEAEVQIATAEAEIVKAEMGELVLRLEQMKRVQNQPDQLREYLERIDRSESTSSLERRLRDVERKLDELIQSLERRQGVLPARAPQPPVQP
jgi:hypothetical protein